MREWNVYRNDIYLGTVRANFEEEARLAATQRWDFEETDKLDVTPR